ncbi:hypothetical protein [Vibrio phage LV6]|nr:hypothetical protein [Vibrio phage LV6]
MALILDRIERKKPEPKAPTKLTLAVPDAPPSHLKEAREDTPQPRHNTNRNSSSGGVLKKYVANVYRRSERGAPVFYLSLGAIFDYRLSRAKAQADSLHVCTGSEFIEVVEVIDPYNNGN